MQHRCIWRQPTHNHAPRHICGAFAASIAADDLCDRSHASSLDCTGVRSSGPQKFRRPTPSHFHVAWDRCWHGPPRLRASRGSARRDRPSLCAVKSVSEDSVHSSVAQPTAVEHGAASTRVGGIAHCGKMLAGGPRCPRSLSSSAPIFPRSLSAASALLAASALFAALS